MRPTQTEREGQDKISERNEANRRAHALDELNRRLGLTLNTDNVSLDVVKHLAIVALELVPSAHSIRSSEVSLAVGRHKAEDAADELDRGRGRTVGTA